MNATHKPKPAASVILLRPAQPQGFQVLVTRRCDETPSLGERYCFLGGSVHESDYADGMSRRCRGLSAGGARKIIGAHLPPRQALGFWVAAVRELFEEVGVLLAVKETGEPLAPDAPLCVRLVEMHTALCDKSLGFQSLLESENLFCDAANLVYFSHWQTPPQFSTRFDTRFFLTAMPDDQTLIAKWIPTGKPVGWNPERESPAEPGVRVEGSAEVADSLWLAPDRALQLFNRGEIPMTFPTFASLRTLTDFGSVQSVLKEFQKEMQGQ